MRSHYSREFVFQVIFLQSWFSKGGPQTSSIRITLELVRTRNPQGHPRPMEQKLHGGAQHSGF